MAPAALLLTWERLFDMFFHPSNGGRQLFERKTAMDHSAIRAELAGRLSPLIRGTETLPAELRPYQIDAIESIRKWLDDVSGPRRAHIAHATGLGKTIIFAAMARVCPGLRMLVIVPTKTLVEQTARVLARFIGGLVGHLSSLGEIRDDNREIVAIRGHEYLDVVVTTVASFNRYAAFIAREFNPQLIIHDECHWAYIKSTPVSLRLFPEAAILGFSATPDYLGTVVKPDYVPVTLENGQVLWGPRERFAEAHFGPRIDERSIRWGIESGWLARLAWGIIEFDVSLNDVPMQDGLVGPDYQEGALRDLLGRHWSAMMETICRLYADPQYNLGSRQSFAVCQNIHAAEELSRAIQSLDIPSACVTGDTPNDERNKILAAYRNNEIRFLSSVMVLREGWDAPNAEVCLMLRPTKSRVLYQQSMGRVVRPAPDGSLKTALVLDAHYQNTQFAPISAAMLYGEPGSRVISGGILLGPRNGGVRNTSHASPFLPRGVVPRLVFVDAFRVEYWAGKDGTFELDGEVWGTQGALAKLLGLSISTVARHINVANVRSRTGKSRGRRFTFYALSDLKKACGELLQELPRAGKNGTFNADNEVWIHRLALSRLLGLGNSTIALRIQTGKVRTRRGLTLNGVPNDFHSLSDVKKACADLLEGGPRVGMSGTFEADGEVWGTDRAVARMLEISPATLRKKADQVRRREGKNRSGRLSEMYSLTDAKRAFAHLLDELPPADKNGTFTSDGELFAPLDLLPSLLDDRIGKIAIVSLLDCDGKEVRTRRGYTRRKRVVDFYAVRDIQELCKEFIKLPQPKPGRAVVIDGEVWASKSVLAQKMGVSTPTITLWVARPGVRSRPGRDRGRACVLYSVGDVRRIAVVPRKGGRPRRGRSTK